MAQLSRLAEMVSAASTTGHRVELRLNDSYQRTKRNSMFACALVIVIGLAGGTTTKIPGLSDVGLPVAGAVSLVWLAALFFMIEFVSEWRMAFVQNSGIAASLPQSDLDDLFVARREQEQATIDAYLSAKRELKATLEQQKLPLEILGDLDLVDFRKKVHAAHELAGRISFIFAQLLDGLHWRDKREEVGAALREAQALAGEIDAAFVNWERAIVAANANLQKIHGDAATLRAEVIARHEEDAALVRLFGTLHKSIHQIQRRSIYRDWAVAAGLMAIATLVTGYHVSQWTYSASCSGSPFCRILDWLR